MRSRVSLLGSPADRFLEALASGEEISDSTVIVSAHPDDETIGVGARMRLFKNLTLIHVTNGAPDRKGAAQRAGFPDPATYSATRFKELEQVLDLLDVQPRRRCLGFVDGATVQSLERLVELLTFELQGQALVITHAYEGGHPDHDSCAFAVQHACSRLAARGDNPPVRIEHTGYHSYRGRLRSGVFWSGERVSTATACLTAEESRAKATALEAFRSQPWLRSVFTVDREVYRAAPLYDFTLPPAPRAFLYDSFGWDIQGITSLATMREAAARLRTMG
jgi:LmbE family N-acetylglucosaminyl deacetylase